MILDSTVYGYSSLPACRMFLLACHSISGFLHSKASPLTVRWIFRPLYAASIVHLHPVMRARIHWIMKSLSRCYLRFSLSIPLFVPPSLHCFPVSLFKICSSIILSPFLSLYSRVPSFHHVFFAAVFPSLYSISNTSITNFLPLLTFFRLSSNLLFSNSLSARVNVTSNLQCKRLQSLVSEAHKGRGGGRGGESNFLGGGVSRGSGNLRMGSSGLPPLMHNSGSKVKDDKRLNTAKSFLLHQTASQIHTIGHNATLWWSGAFAEADAVVAVAAARAFFNHHLRRWRLWRGGEGVTKHLVPVASDRRTADDWSFLVQNELHMWSHAQRTLAKFKGVDFKELCDKMIWLSRNYFSYI